MTQIQVSTQENHLLKWLIWSMESEISLKVLQNKNKEEVVNERSQRRNNQKMIKVTMKMTFLKFLKIRRNERRSFQTRSMCLTLEAVVKRNLICLTINHNNHERRRRVRSKRRKILKDISSMRKEFDCSTLTGIQLEVILTVRNHRWITQTRRKCQRRRRRKSQRRTRLENQTFYLLAFSLKLKNQTVMGYLRKREKQDDKNQILPHEEEVIDL